MLYLDLKILFKFILAINRIISITYILFIICVVIFLREIFEKRVKVLNSLYKKVDLI